MSWFTYKNDELTNENDCRPINVHCNTLEKLWKEHSRWYEQIFQFQICLMYYPVKIVFTIPVAIKDKELLVTIKRANFAIVKYRQHLSKIKLRKNISLLAQITSWLGQQVYWFG